MQEFTVILDGISDYEETTYVIDNEDIFSNLDAMREDVKQWLREMDGGHADIFNEDGEWIEDIEV